VSIIGKSKKNLREKLGFPLELLHLKATGNKLITLMKTWILIIAVISLSVFNLLRFTLEAKIRRSIGPMDYLG